MVNLKKEDRFYPSSLESTNEMLKRFKKEEEKTTKRTRFLFYLMVTWSIVIFIIGLVFYLK